MRRAAFRELAPRAVLAVALTVLAVCALGAVSPAARADGDPGSDVLVHQNLFVAADSNISIPQQVAASAGLAGNPDLDPGTSLSETAPGFTLTDQFGQPASLSAYRGKVVILAFNDSEFVINQQGRLAKLYLTQLAYSAVPQLGQLLANEVSTLLPGHPAVHSHLSYDQVATVGPAASTTVPEAGGGYVSLGPSQPGEPSQARLYLFFASWDREITSLGGQLDALNAYQSAAAAARLPGLTAIDEGSVEPSASALPSLLAGLRQPLSYPVGIDGSGQIADGYGVQGESYFVLASASGQPIWTWEVSTSGWLSTASLDRHVRAALASAAKTKTKADG